MKKYLLFIAALAVLLGCKKHESVESSVLEGTATKTYSMSVRLMAGQHIEVGTVEFYDPTDGNGGPLEVTYILTGGWTMSESHVYAGPVGDMPRNNPGTPKVGKFPYKETHANVTTYTYYIPVSDTNRFAIAAHCVVNNNGGETAWAEGNETFNDKGWGTYISNFYSIANYQIDELYGIVETNDGGLNIVLIDGNNGTSELIVSEYITGSGSVSNPAFDLQTNSVFFMIGNNLYANDMNSEAPSYFVGTFTSANINGATFMNGSYYYYDGNLNKIMKAELNYTSGSGWSLGTVTAYSEEMPSSSYFTVTDITINDVGFYLIGIDNNNNTVDVYDYGISTSGFSFVVSTSISAQLDSPTLAWNATTEQLYGISIGTGGNNILVSIDLTNGDATGDPDVDTNPSEIPDKDILIVEGLVR
jgi:hypothetical protein